MNHTASVELVPWLESAARSRSCCSEGRRTQARRNIGDLRTANAAGITVIVLVGGCGAAYGIDSFLQVIHLIGP